METKKLIRAGVSGLIALASAGCQSNNSIGIPPQIIVEKQEFSERERGERWKQEGNYWYRTEVTVRGKKYHPESLDEARKLENQIRLENKYKNIYDFILKEHPTAHYSPIY
ncbi:hypothetical protein J4402_02185 [Candidatus Pacearchaeota archaeon]|nr:hypothetical protein [uncultured archaeon]AQS31870.1 hypothetical protein [uncultured archaeon]MBS3088567.1 hypothetical protein [Candidatus Pacearchaeota archaeon]